MRKVFLDFGKFLFIIGMTTPKAFGFDYCQLNETYAGYSDCYFVMFNDYNIAGIPGTAVKVDSINNFTLYEDSDGEIYLSYVKPAYFKPWQIDCLTKESLSKQLRTESEFDQYLSLHNLRRLYMTTNSTLRNEIIYQGEHYTVMVNTLRYDSGKIMNRIFYTVRNEDYFTDENHR